MKSGAGCNADPAAPDETKGHYLNLIEGQHTPESEACIQRFLRWYANRPPPRKVREEDTLLGIWVRQHIHERAELQRTSRAKKRYEHVPRLNLARHTRWSV